MLFYYTATGNCLYVAKKLESQRLSIPQELKKEHNEYQDNMIGIVSPIYAGELPKSVRRFIEKSTFKTDYFYLILTYGKDDSVASTWSEDFCRQNNIKVDYIQTILMVDNYLPSFDMNEEMTLDKKVDEQIHIALTNLQQRVKYIPQPEQAAKDLYAMVSSRFSEHPELNNGQTISMSKRCEGCQICKQVCPIGNIEVIDGQAKRINEICDFCLACVHHCPFKAIDLKYDKNPQARYRHLNVSLKEIVESNHQK